MNLGLWLVNGSSHPITLPVLRTMREIVLLLIIPVGGAMLLLVVGVAVFREKLSLANSAGIVLCLVGLWRVNRR